jgi:MFS family permease
MADSRIVRIWFAIVVFTTGLHGTIPLSSHYRAELGASTGDITLLYSVYAFALIPALVVFGTWSDAVGRRRIVLPGLILSTGASLLFSVATNLPELFAARAAQGWATGMFWGAASAFLLDHVDAEHRLDASLALSATFMGCTALGIFVFGVTFSALGSVAWPWFLHTLAMLVVIGVILSVPETRPRLERRRATVALPGPMHRRAFLTFITPVTFALIGLGAFVVALGPRFVEEARPSSSTGLQGAPIAIALGLGAGAQMVTRRVTVSRVISVGALLLPLGGAVLAVAVEAHTLIFSVVGMGLVGTGMGLSFRGLFAMSEQMTTSADRAGVISTFSIVFYLANAVPVVAGGYAVAGFGLGRVTAVLSIFAAVATAAAYAVLRKGVSDRQIDDAYVA